MDHDGHLKGTPAYRRLTLAMLLAGFSTFSLLYAVQPLLPVFASDYGLSAEASSLAISLATGPLAFAILAAGGLSDRIGRRPLMIGAIYGGAILTVGVALAPSWPALLTLRFLTGIALAGIPSVAMAYVAEEVHVASVGSAMGLYVAGTALGGMGGRLIAGIATDLIGWRGSIGIVGVSGLAMAEAFRRLVPPSRRFVAKSSAYGGIATLLGDRALALLYAEAFVLMGVFVTIYNYAGFRLSEPPYRLGQTAVSAVFLLYLLGSVSSAWFGALAGRLGRRHVFWATVLILAIGIVATAMAPLALVVAGIGIVTIGFFGAHSIASAWVGRRAAGNRGQAAALYLFFYYLGSSIVGSLGGIAWTRFAWPGVASFCLTLAAIALVGALILRSVEPVDPALADTSTS